MWIGWILLVLILCSSCDNKQENNIQWQLPLQAPEDAHAANFHSELPEWAKVKQGQIELVFLHKNTAQKADVLVVKNKLISFKGWQVQLLGLAQGLRIKSGALLDDPNMHNAAAFVELIKDDNLIYRGWLYKDFPELFGLDNSGWKVWLKSVSIQPSSKEEKVGSLSSAG